MKIYIRKPYTKGQKIVIGILSGFNTAIFVRVSVLFFDLLIQYLSASSAIAQNQMYTILCTYSSFISLYLFIEHFVVVFFPSLNPARVSKSLASDINKVRINLDIYSGKCRNNTLEEMCDQVNEDITNWTNPVKVALFTLIHFVYAAAIVWKITEGWFLPQILIDIISFLVIPTSLFIAIYSTVVQRNILDPNVAIK